MVDGLKKWMTESNSENNVTAQVLAALWQSGAGRQILGTWLTGDSDATAVSATFFWFPLRDAIANFFYQNTKEMHWKGYRSLFDSVGLTQQPKEELPPGHPKNRDWSAQRFRPEVEIVAELASTEFDAAFLVAHGTGHHLYLVEAKWLSGLGPAGRIGQAGFALNQVQRAIALASWLHTSSPGVPVTYTVCSTGDIGKGQVQAKLLEKNALEDRQLYQDFIEGVRVVGENARSILPKTWRELRCLLPQDGQLGNVRDFLGHHGVGRPFRKREADLCP